MNSVVKNVKIKAWRNATNNSRRLIATLPEVTAYFWIVNTAIISPHYDIEYNDGPPQSFVFGDSKTRINHPSTSTP